jgi:hypothetical protein
MNGQAADVERTRKGLTVVGMVPSG